MDTENDFDIDAGVADIAQGLGIGIEEEAEAPPEDEAIEAPPQEAIAAPEVVARAAPQSWAKDRHEVWSKLPPDAQDYIEQRERQMHEGLSQYKEHHELGRAMRETVTPYMPILTAQGIDPPKAFASLLNAHYRLTQGSPEQRSAAYEQLGVTLGIRQASQQQQVDPNVRAALERVERLEGALTQKQQQEYQQARVKTEAEVTAFASDPANTHFDDVAEDVIVFINAGMSLKDAYEKAVWANPVTRAKETARLQSEAQASLREKSKQDAERAKKASGSNVRSRDTRKAPTEPLGKMDDTMRETLKDIRERSPH
jgi:hypothetical protein